LSITLLTCAGQKQKKGCPSTGTASVYQSEWRDSNSRPLDPQSKKYSLLYL
jgi:hypothetical protein